MSTEVAVYNDAPPPLAVADMKAQVNLIQHVMKEVMKKDEHYGIIPGTNGKPSLLKAGAEKLIMTFRLVPDVYEQTIDIGGGHREVRVTVRLSTQNGIFLGAGVGSCSTMEGKYRFRTGPKTLTGTPVPKEYWDNKRTDPAKAQEIIGGAGYSTAKDDSGQWVIAIQGEKVEHDNPADYYNTVLKMAKKRALVDACLTVTAASDIFTQDIEDMPEVIPGAAKAGTIEKPPISEPQKKSEKAAQAQDGSEYITAIITNVTRPAGENKPWAIIADGKKFTFFSDSIGEEAEKLKGQAAIISFVKKGNFFNCTGVQAGAGVKEKASDPENCTKNPGGCEHSLFDDAGNAGCEATGEDCPHGKKAA